MISFTCDNCDGRKWYVSEMDIYCFECDWREGEPVPDFPLCSICRRRHGSEVVHEAE